LLKGMGAGNGLLTANVPLAELKAAGRAAGGSVNDAYVAAVLGGVRRYHERHHVMVDTIPIAMPVSIRTKDDPAGGNKFAGVRFTGPLAECDPAARIKLIGDFVRGIRDEPAISFMNHASAALTLLPNVAIAEVSARLTTASDLQISNIRGLDRRAFLAGAEVLAMYPLGPRPGVAAMVTLLTYNGMCCIGLNVDPGVFTDIVVLAECLLEGFGEVIELGGAQITDVSS
jgi:hypothetical protein